MPKLLFEIGCEELPASACREAQAQLPQLCRQHVGAAPARLFVGPRRLGFLVEDLPEMGADAWAKGPPVALRERAAEGFARRHGVSADELEERDGFLGVAIPGQPLAETLPERLAAVVRGLQFSKSMSWGVAGLRFSRPVRWLCAKLDDRTLEIALDGIPSGGTSWGRRFHAGRVEIPTAGAYVETLRQAGVEPDRAERWRLIVEGLDAIGGWSDPGGVLEEVVHLVEWPHVLEGSFDERYVRLPERVVVTTMQSHQRYLPLGGARFAFVANGGDPDIVRAGNERVLEARLEDASFTFERDVAVGIEGLAARLGSITFFAGAGSFADKAERLVRLVEELGGGEDAREAARFAKVDQAAELVREFPELEGHIGAEYARLAGRPEAVCRAIEEQYLPDAAGGPLPETQAGRTLAAADKLDTLTVAFGLGRRPSGSRDPYGLRRAAIGLCRLAVEGGLTIDLLALDPEVRTFVEERLEGLVDVPVELVRAARHSSMRDLGGVAALARALAELDDARLGAAHTAYTRADRIAGGREAAWTLDPELLRDDAERELAAALESAALGLGRAAERDFETAFSAAAALAPPLERFFEEVLVLAEETAVRENRLRLLLDVRDAVGRLGDLSLIPR